MKKLFLIVCIFFLGGTTMAADNNFATDIFKTNQGDLAITFIGHGTLMISFDRKTIYIDPVSQYADYGKLPKADLILITHEHSDHFDIQALAAVKTEKTVFLTTEIVARKIPGSFILKNGDEKTVQGIKIEAVPAYNIVHMRSPGTPFHPRGTGNGYVITCADKHIYVAGDTENVPEMKNLRNIDIAFLPMNIPYTMTPEMVADAARAFQPGILYPYHYGNTDAQKLIELLKSEKNIEVRIRKMM